MPQDNHPERSEKVFLYLLAYYLTRFPLEPLVFPSMGTIV